MTKMMSRLSYRTALMGAALIAATLPFTGTAEARSVEEAKASGEVTIGIQGDNCPWGCLSATGEAQGFDADMARAFAKYLGLEIEFVPLAVANRIPALTADKVDALIASMGMTAERAQTIQFSQPYASNKLFVTAPKDVTITGPAELSGLVIGVPRSSPMDTNLTKIAPKDANLRRFDDDAANIQAMLSGQVNAVGANQFYIQRLDAAAAGVYENKFEIGQLFQGIATRKGEADWNAAANAFLTEFLTTAEYQALYEKWLQLAPSTYPASMEGIPFTVTP